MSKKPKQVNMSKKDEPIICPLLSIACPTEEEFTNCMKEACWFYSRKMKMCATVIQALALSNITMSQITRSGTSLLEKSLKRRLNSVARMHRSKTE